MTSMHIRGINILYDGRPTFAEIDLSALHHNFQIIRTSIPKRTEILAVVKADAYGHGFMDISRELEKLGVNAFGVAFLAEGIQLRKSGIDKPILLLGGVYPGQERKCIGLQHFHSRFYIGAGPSAKPRRRQTFPQSTTASQDRHRHGPARGSVLINPRVSR